MLRQELPHYDPDLIAAPIVYAAQGLFPQRVDIADVFYVPKLVSGLLSPPFFVSDDVFFNFSTQTVLRTPLVIDSGMPVLPATAWDGVNDGVTISSDGLNATLTASRIMRVRVPNSPTALVNITGRSRSGRRMARWIRLAS